jgi:hypothetical protein
MNNNKKIDITTAAIELFYHPNDKQVQENYISAVDHTLAQILNSIHKKRKEEQ